MAKHIVLLMVMFCVSSLAMGQTLQEQKACYVQTHKVASKLHQVTVSNHFDAHTKTCWVKEFSLFNGIMEESIYNAFEPTVWETEFSQNTSNLKPGLCLVHDTKCSNVAEFEKLTKQRYGF